MAFAGTLYAVTRGCDQGKLMTACYYEALWNVHDH
jgi:hypothetical protein